MKTFLEVKGVIYNVGAWESIAYFAVTIDNMKKLCVAYAEHIVCK
jgi:hypothetical protein